MELILNNLTSRFLMGQVQAKVPQLLAQVPRPRKIKRGGELYPVTPPCPPPLGVVL